MNITEKRVFITTRWEDFHCRPDAPDKVDFLRDIHRHIFWLRLEVSVSHNDRDIEFILLKRWVEEQVIPVIKGGALKSNMSCEGIAEYIIERVEREYAPNKVVCEVSEDGENGAVLVAEK